MNISADRIATVTDVTKEYVSNFNPNYNTEEAKQDFFSIYDPAVNGLTTHSWCEGKDMRRLLVCRSLSLIATSLSRLS